MQILLLLELELLLLLLELLLELDPPLLLLVFGNHMVISSGLLLLLLYPFAHAFNSWVINTHALIDSPTATAPESNITSMKNAAASGTVTAWYILVSLSAVTVIPASCPTTYDGTFCTVTITLSPELLACTCAASGLTIINNASTTPTLP